MRRWQRRGGSRVIKVWVPAIAKKGGKDCQRGARKAGRHKPVNKKEKRSRKAKGKKVVQRRKTKGDTPKKEKKKAKRRRKKATPKKKAPGRGCG